MRKIPFLFLTIILLSNYSFSQACLPEGITFQYQEEIDNFEASYPGCTVIEGNVNIWTNDITNLDGLSVINRIGGNLFIHNTYYLSDLSGLQNIDTIEGSLALQSNLNLTSLNGLEDLAYVGGSVDIFNNTRLNNLTGLRNLTNISGFLEIAITDSLKNLTGLENLTMIGGNFTLGSNEALENVDGLENLLSIGGRLDITYNYNLTSLAGLQSLDPYSVTELYLYWNPSLSACSEPFICAYVANPPGSVNIYNNSQGCNNPSEVAGSCGITLSCLPFGNYYFLSQNDINNFPSNFPDCNDLQGDVKISGSDVASLEGLNQLTTVGGGLEINFNDVLSNLSGLENLRYVGENFELMGNDFLTGAQGIENLGSTGDLLIIGGNPVLEDLTGFIGLTRVGGTLDIEGNDSLKNLNGLGNLHFIEEGLIIYDNNAITNLYGLNNLDTIGTVFEVWWNDALVSLSALKNTKLIRAVNINGNQLLTSLSGLDNIDPDSIHWLEISNNALLSDCDVRSICDYLAGPDTTADIHSNATGCYNRDEVEAACRVGMSENQSDNLCYVFPDPVGSFATFKFQVNDPGRVKIELYNNTGQELETIIDEDLPVGSHFISWNARHLPPGLYFYRTLTIDKGQMTVGKLIKN